MIQNFFSKFKNVLHEVLDKLPRSDKRKLLAGTAEAIGKGGQSLVAEEFHVSRDTIRKGTHELRTGITCEDAFHARGRKKAEERLPNLIRDIKDIVDGQSQTDPSFNTTRLTVKEIRKQLIEKKGYTDEKLPSNQTLNTKINELGYQLKKSRK